MYAMRLLIIHIHMGTFTIMGQQHFFTLDQIYCILIKYYSRFFKCFFFFFRFQIFGQVRQCCPKIVKRAIYLVWNITPSAIMQTTYIDTYTVRNSVYVYEKSKNALVKYINILQTKCERKHVYIWRSEFMYIRITIS